MRSADNNNEVYEFLKKEFNANSVNKIFPDLDIYDVYIKEEEPTYQKYDFNLIHKYGDSINETYEQYVIIQGLGLVLPYVNKGETQEEYEKRVFPKQILFYGPIPDIMYSRNRYHILVDKNGNSLSSKKYRFVGRPYIYPIDESSSIEVSIVRNCAEKCGLIDKSCTDIVPTIFDSISLKGFCQVTFNDSSKFLCKFLPLKSLYSRLISLDENKLQDIDEKNELYIQLVLFDGFIIINPLCISLIKVISTPDWKSTAILINDLLKDNVDNSRLLTKRNILKIIDSMDSNTIESSNQAQ